MKLLNIFIKTIAIKNFWYTIVLIVTIDIGEKTMELFHFIPAFIAIIALAFGLKSSVKANVIALSAAIFGLAFGNSFHVHASHSAMIFDPCYINAVVAAFSAFKIAKIKLAARKAA